MKAHDAAKANLDNLNDRTTEHEAEIEDNGDAIAKLREDLAQAQIG